MDSKGRLLIGGALGAALGYLLSQRDQNEEQTAETVFSPTPTSTTAAPAPSPTLTAATESPVAPDHTTDLTSEPDVIVTRQLLEEPLPGSGWSPSVPSAVEDETLESTTVEEVVEVPIEEAVVAPETEERPPDAVVGPGTANTEALAQAADVMGRLSGTESPASAESARVDDLKSRIEETRRRIRRELEQPFDASSFGGSSESDWTTAPAVPLADEVDIAQAPVAHPEVPPVESTGPLVSEPEPTAEPMAVESPTLDTVEPESLPIESAVAEQVEVREPGVEETTPTTTGPDALIAEPMITSATVPTPPVAPRVVPAQPVTPEPPIYKPEAPAPEVSAPEAPAPEVSAPEAPAPEVSAPDMDAAAAAAPEPVDLETTLSDADLSAEVGVEEPVDYDSMKNRIESTRSRLKAKAFDAMMTGESALLGRDVDGTTSDKGGVSGVDDEVDETIETSLREEEE